MSEMTVGCIRTTVMPQQSGIYEALLEKAERDAAELADRLSGLELSTAKQLAELERERDEAREESLEQAHLLGKGGEREARLITERDHWKRMYEEADWKTVEAETYKKELMETRKDRNKWGFYGEKMQQERDHYKQALEEVSSSIDDWLNSLIQEPSLDFIHAIKAWADKKLKEI